MASKEQVSGLTEKLDKASLTHVNEISFAGRSLKLDSEEDAVEIIQAIKDADLVNALRLEGNTVGVQAAKAIAATLEHRPEIERLLWSDMFTGRLRSEIPPSMDSLGNAVITAQAHLVEFDLSDNAFGPDGVKACVKLLSSRPCFTLKILKLNNNGLGTLGGKILAKALLDCHKASSEEGKPLALQTFISGRNRLENKGSEALAEAFKTMGSLVEVSMPQNGIQHEGIAALADAFKSNPNLKVLNLNDNIFTEKGAAAMAEAFPHLPDLEVINFGDCLLRPGGGRGIALALKESVHQLKELVLSFCELDRSTGVDVCKAVSNKKNLTKLDLNGNAFGEDGIDELKSVLERQTQLDVLGSLSDDEEDGQDDEDEDQDEEEEEENVSARDDNEGELSEDLALQIQGIALKADSPLLQNNDSTSQEVSIETVKGFLENPSLEKLQGIPKSQRTKLLKQSLKDDASDPNSITKIFVKVVAALKDCPEAMNQCADAILSMSLEEGQIKPEHIGNYILVYLGLLKGEEKPEIKADIPATLNVLKHVVKQEYFPRCLVGIFIAFFSRPSAIMTSHSSDCHQLLQTLYTL